ncbi:Pre-mRNA-splicing factor ATP-dependent RNA helicase dhx15 [Elasticomyces elasticus]|nr:Pre-mRNA-splicing factor ATP-dependent RNA helicase dhx15 [Elasticomyces elasticus]
MAAATSTSLNPLNGQPYGTKYFALREQASTLPVRQQMKQILQSIKTNQVTIVVAETGSGKTTQIPKEALLDSEEMMAFGGLKVCLTQPRRIAAESVCERIADECGVPLLPGQTASPHIGLHLKGTDTTSQTSRLDVLTDGTLLQIARSDPLLSAYGVIFIDEAHQHSGPTDLLLGIIKLIIREGGRPDLKLVIMSATLDAASFQTYFPEAKLVEVGGRTFPVEVSYLQTAASDVIGEIVETVVHVHRTQAKGDILVFVSGTVEIFKVMQGVERFMERSGTRLGPLKLLPLHAKLSAEETYQTVHSPAPVAFGRKIGRKVIISTNIAETSITFSNVTHVVDSCKSKSRIWNPRQESWSLPELPISQAVAKQRSGRAGRTRPGTAWRMCTESAFHRLALHTTPSILEGDMVKETLQILDMDRNIAIFPFMAPPATETLAKALGLLYHINAVDGLGVITPRGRVIAKIPIDVYSAVVLLESPRFGCSDEMISLIAMREASEGNPFVPAPDPKDKTSVTKARGDFRHPGGSDDIILFNVYMSWRQNCIDGTEEDFLQHCRLRGSVLVNADRIRLQLLQLLKRTDGWTLLSMSPSKPTYWVSMMRALAAGYSLQVAKRNPRNPAKFQTCQPYAMDVKVPKESQLGDDVTYVLYGEHVTGGQKGPVLRMVTPINIEWLINALPGYWYKAESLPAGHIQERNIEVLAAMASKPAAYFRGGMPPPPPAEPTSTK